MPRNSAERLTQGISSWQVISLSAIATEKHIAIKNKEVQITEHLNSCSESKPSHQLKVFNLAIFHDPIFYSTGF